MSTCIVTCHFALPVPSDEKFIASAKKSVPMFRKLGPQGLLSKDYVHDDRGVGGIYVWKDRAAAEAWFTEQKIVEYTTTFGVRPVLTWFDSLLTVDNVADEVRVQGQRLPEG